MTLLATSGLALLIALKYILHNAEPIVRKRVIETLAARFHAPVALDRLDISLFKGIEVNGYGLRVGYGAGTVSSTSGRPMVAVEHFAFRTGVRGLLRQPTHVSAVRVDGLELHVPPPGDREDIRDEPHAKEKIAIVADALECRDVKVFIESGRPEVHGGHKAKLEFDIATLDMRDVGRDQAMVYDAQLTNPKPQGAIHAVGHFGPWAGGTATQPGEPHDPGQTPIDGKYTFDHAELNSIHGLGGTLSSAGHFSGVLDRITVDGTTDTPDFSLDVSSRAVPLHTEFHAIVDGTSGDTFLSPVRARLGRSEFTTVGKVVKVNGGGHDIQLAVVIPKGRMEDFLRVAVKTSPPLMIGPLSMQAKLHIPPGPERVSEKMEIAGTLRLTGVRFSNAHWQDQLDALSARAQGRPRQVAAFGQDREATVRSQLDGNFALGRGVLTVTNLQYAVPGATMLLNGVYSLNGRLFAFKGHVRTEATASQMVTGWKSLLLKPVEGLLKAHGAGMELPVEISGTEGDLHMGLALHGVDETPRQMLAEVKQRRREEREEAAARQEAALADAEDAAAARAPTIEAAEQAHKAAVRHRAEAQSKLATAHRSPLSAGR